MVKRKHAKIPTAKQDKKRIKAQIKLALKRAKKLPTSSVPANTVYTGGSAAGGVEYFGMLPATLTVPSGTTVTFAMSLKSFEAHTATFGPGNPETEPSSYLGAIAASFEGAATRSARRVPERAAAGGGRSYAATLHGNGFWNSGVMDASARLAAAARRTR